MEITHLAFLTAYEILGSIPSLIYIKNINKQVNKHFNKHFFMILFLRCFGNLRNNLSHFLQLQGATKIKHHILIN